MPTATSTTASAVDVIDTWTGSRVRLLRLAFRLTLDAFAEHLGVVPRTVSNWESRPKMVPTPEIQRALDVALGSAAKCERVRFGLLLAAEQSEDVTERSASPRGTSGRTDDIFASAARSTALDVSRVGASLGNDMLDHLSSHVIALARDYTERPLADEFADLRQLRDQAIALLDQTKRPAELADLHVAIGQATALMASVAFDLGRWTEASQLAAASTMYADSSGHASLRAWTLGLQATLAFWRRQPDVALGHIERGLAGAPPGAPRVRLHHIGARAHAVAGNPVEADRLLEAAQDDRATADGVRDHLHDEVGGEFAFDDARAAACSTAVWLELRDGSRIEDSAHEALTRYAGLPADRQPSAPILGTRLDLAAGRLYAGDVRGAEEQLRPVLSSAIDVKVSLTGRMAKLRRLLGEQHLRNNRTAVELAVAVGEWLSMRPVACT